MALYLTKLVNGQVQKLRVSPTKALYRGYWAVIVGGFAGTSVTCNGVTKFIGSSERVAFNIITPGTYTFTATRQGTTITKEVVLNDDTQEYIINLSMFIGMQQLEYIESTGTQYIDTGILPNSTTAVDISVMFNTIVADSSVPLGSRSTGLSGDSPDQFYISASTGSGIICRSGTNISTLIQNPSVNTRYNLSASNSYATADGTYTLTLFGFNNKGTIDNKFSQKIYSCKIYDNGVLVRDFIPIKDDTGHGALYDKVTQQIFYNSGTGDFICGPNNYTRIQYIESTGTQYIDTGVYANGNTRWDLDTQLINTNRLYIFGSGGAEDPGLTSIRAGGKYKYYTFIRNTKEYSPGYVPIDLQRHTFVNDIYNGKVKVDHYEIDNIEQFKGASYKIYIGAYNRIGDVDLSWGWVAKYYNLKIYDNDVLIRDFIPVLDEDGVPCMYDLVEGKFYYNAGTGQFIAGPEE